MDGAQTRAFIALLASVLSKVRKREKLQVLRGLACMPIINTWLLPSVSSDDREISRNCN